MKVRHIYEPLYDARVTFIFGTPEKAEKYLISKGMKDKDDSHPLKLCFGQTGRYEVQKENFIGVRYFIYVEDHKNCVDSLCHEIVHLVFQIFKDTNILISEDNDEAFAYYYEHWFRNLSSLLRKW